MRLRARRQGADAVPAVTQAAPEPVPFGMRYKWIKPGVSVLVVFPPNVSIEAVRGLAEWLAYSNEVRSPKADTSGDTPTLEMRLRLVDQGNPDGVSRICDVLDRYCRLPVEAYLSADGNPVDPNSWLNTARS